jgi:hypothetical protein
MKNIILKFCFLLAILFSTSCQKENLPTKVDSDTPVFFIEGELDGVYFKNYAGVNDWYMNTSNEDLLGTGASISTGNLSSNNSDYQIRLIPSSIALGNNENIFLTGPIKVHAEGVAALHSHVHVDFPGLDLTSKPGMSMNWIWGGIQNSSTGSADFIIQPNDWNNHQKVQSTYTQDNGESATQLFSLNQYGLTMLGKLELDLPTNSVKAIVLVGSYSDQNPNWYIDGVKENYDKSIIGLKAGTHSYKFTYESNSGAKCEMERRIFYDPSNLYPTQILCEFPTGVYPRVQTTQTVPSNSNGNIDFQITTQDGKVLKSANTFQPIQNYVIIESIDDYENDKNGNPTKKIKLSFNINLADSSGKVYTLKNGKAVFAVGK